MENKTGIHHLLVFRFSSMGDVAMTVPVVKQLLIQHPYLAITFVSDKKFAALFENIPNLEFYGADLKNQHKGFAGILRLFNELKKKNITAIADLHNVLRTRVLGALFKATGKKVERIDKGRKEKKELTRKNDKKLVQLPSTFQRYANVFTQLGYPLILTPTAERTKLPIPASVKELIGNDNLTSIGIAPFAKHKEKTYPLEEMQKVVTALSVKGYKLFLFGGGNEASQLQAWAEPLNNVVNVAGKLSFKEELMLISNLDLMISMDSANMHFASLYSVPVVSIWGATHPFAGFYGFAQNPLNAVQGELYCRPCSVFGNKPCYRGDWACMHLFTPGDIVAKIESVLQHEQA